MMPDEPHYKAPAFQFYADDFVADTVGFTAEEVGAYVRMMCWQWKQGAIPSDLDRLAIVAGVAPARMRVIWKTLEGKYEPHPTLADAFVQPRLERVRAEAAQRARSGSIGGSTRVANFKRTPKQNASEHPSKTQANTQANLKQNASEQPSKTQANTQAKLKQNASEHPSKTQANTQAKVNPPVSNNDSEAQLPRRPGDADAPPTWCDPIRAEVKAVLDVVLCSLTQEQRVSLGRYCAKRWANFSREEKKNLAQGILWAAQIESIGAKMRFAQKTVREFIGAGDRTWKLGGEAPLRNLWAITSALGEDAA